MEKKKTLLKYHKNILYKYTHASIKDALKLLVTFVG